MQRRKAWAAGLAALLLLAIVVLFVVPAVVRGRAIAEAKARGIELHIEGARWTLSGIRFTKLEARFEKIPGAAATAREATVGLSGLTPEALELEGLDLTVPDLLSAAARLDEQRAAAQGAGNQGALQRLFFHDALVHLARFAGESTSLELAGVSAELSLPEGNDAHAHAGKVTGTLGASPFGPWVATVDKKGAEEKLALSLDAAGTSVVTFKRDPAATTFDVKIPRSHIKALGLPFSAFGLTAEDDPEVQVEAGAMRRAVSGDADGALLFEAWGLHLGPLPGASEMKLGTKWKGNGEAAAIHDGVFLVGPFGGNLQGTVRTRSPRLDLGFESTPVPCADLAAGAAAGAMPGFLGSLVNGKGITGNVVLSGTLVFDLANPAKNALTLKPSADCSFTLR